MSSDLKTILAGEFQQLGMELAALAPQLHAGDDAAAEQSLVLCERLGQVAALVQLPMLQDLAVYLMGNIGGSLGAGEQGKSVATICFALEHCLRATGDAACWEQLACELAADNWPAPMQAETAAGLIASLLALQSADEANVTEPAPMPELADLSLKLSDDVSAETRRAYFAETPLLAAELSVLLANDDALHSPDTGHEAQRLIHTIKGSSALVGLSAIAQLAHALETALQRVDASSNPWLSPAADAIEALMEQAVEGGEATPDLLALIHALYAPTPVTQPQAVLETDVDQDAVTIVVDNLPDLSAELNDEQALAMLMSSASIASAPTESIASVASSSAELITIKPVVPKSTPVLVAAAPNANDAGPTLNVSVAIIDDNLRRTGEFNTAIGQLIAHVGETLRRADQLTQQLARVQGQVYELETLVDTRGVPAVYQVAGQHAGQGTKGFDPLEMDEYTALHSLSRAFSESTLDSRELSRELSEELLKLQNLLAQHARQGRELNESVTGARLVPVTTIAPRLERIVRQTARHTQREVELVIRGRELSIDTDILNGLVEPLMHALRNAIDHGIESAEERIKMGKSPNGRIELDFRREGNRIEVRVNDDGRGLDLEAIARRAHERGLLTDGQPVSERELTQLIFKPGFSTRATVSAISGRGIGMDVVRTSIERLKGTINLESKRGAGCSLLLRLPLSLTSQHTLFVSVAGCVYGLPSTSVEQVLYSDAGHIVTLGDRLTFEYGEQIAPLYSLAALLGHAEDGLDDLDTTPRPIVLVGSDEGLVALVADRALDSRQTVIKGLSPLLPSMPGVAGAAVMPDGGIGVILEVRELLRAPQPTTRMQSASMPHVGKQARHALVVDDSLSARRGLAQLLADAGYTVSTAIDGIDALAQIETTTPDLILLDMEMPRMNGLELTAHLRGNNSWRDLPIVMITSRAADKHRSQALRTGVSEYVTKPYLEHELIDRLYTLAPP